MQDSGPDSLASGADPEKGKPQQREGARLRRLVPAQIRAGEYLDILVGKADSQEAGESLG